VTVAEPLETGLIAQLLEAVADAGGVISSTSVAAAAESASNSGALPPGLEGIAPPGQGGTAPGQGGTPPGQGKKN